MEERLKIWSFIREKAVRYGNKTALVYGERKLSYAELIRLVESTRISARALTPVLEETPFDTATAILKNLYAGHIVVPLNKSYGKSYCRGIWVDLGFHTAEEVDEDVAFLLYTSGSTARPKGVMLSSKNVLSNLVSIESYFNLGESDKLLIARPLMHASVLTGEFLYGLYKGAEIHLYPEAFMPARVAGYILSNNITTLGCTPTLLQTLLPYLQKSGAGSLKNLAVSGEILTKDFALKIARSLPQVNVYSVYGLTEAAPRVSALLPQEFAGKPGSVGKPIQNVEMKLNKEEPCLTEEGFTGALMVRSPGVMRGYFADEALTKEKIDADGWLFTGDIARRDPDGYYYILGRADNMIIRGGVNIYPEGMEALLKKDRRIRQAVLSAENTVGITPFLRLKIVGDLTREEAVALCRAQLPSFAQPNCIEIVEEIEFTPSGKVRRA